MCSAYPSQADTPYVTAQTVTVVYTSFSAGLYGMKVTTGPTNAPTVTSLGRYVLSGNSHTHFVELVRASDLAVLASATVATSGVAAGTYAYAALGTPVTLSANTSYYILSQEGPTVDSFALGMATASSVATAVGPESGPSLSSLTTYPPTSGQDWGPVNFLYTGGDPTAAPTAPASLTAYPADGRVTLSWPAAPAADGYSVYRSATPGSGYALVSGAGAVTSTVYDDRPLTNGTPYYYVVQAVNAVGASANSPEAAATPAGVPAGATAFVSGQTLLGTSSTNTGLYGAKFTTGPTNAPVVTSLGRFVVSGNSRAHLVQVVRVSDLSVVASAQVATQGVSANTYAYANLPSPVSLAANTAYYLVSQEVTGQDTFRSSLVTTTSAGSVQGLVAGITVPNLALAANTAGQEWGPVNFLYTGGLATAAPAAPAGLAAYAGDGRAQLSWTASAGADGYNVYRSATQGSGYALVNASGPVAATQYGDRPLTNGTTYYYVVQAVNAAGSSGNSNEASARPGPAPGGSTAFVTGQTNTVTYTSFTYGLYGMRFATGSAAPTVTGLGRYVSPGNSRFHLVEIVRTSDASVVAAAQVDTQGASAGSYAYAYLPSPVLLAANTAYSVVSQETPGLDAFMLASSTTVTGAASILGVVSGATPSALSLYANTAGEDWGPVNFTYTLPASAPVGLTATPGPSGSSPLVTLAWTTSPNVTYTLKRSAASGGPYSVVSASATTPYSDTAVSAGTAYYYVVTATNASGESAASNEAAATTASAALGAPSGLSATASVAAGAAQVAVAWSPVGGASNYNVYRGPSAGGELATPLATGVTGPSYVDSAAGFGATWFYVVTAVGSGGEGARSAEASATTAPPAPAGLAAAAAGTTVGLSWSASSTAASYSVYRGTASGGEAATPVATGLTGTSFSDAGLAPGTAYWYAVSATNGGGEGPRGAEATATTQALPAAPSGLSAVGGVRQTVLAWTAASGAASYNVYRGVAAGMESGTPVNAGPVTVATFTDTGLGDGTQYFYTVKAVNAAGTGSPSAEASTYTLPAAPTALAATPGNTIVTLAWTPVPGATGYNVYRGSAAGAEAGSPVNTALVSGTTFTDTGLANGAAYYYVVRAANTSGDGPRSDEGSATPSAPATGGPTGLIATGGYQQIALAWNGVPGASTYSVYRGTGPGAEDMDNPVASDIATPAFTDTDVNIGQTYWYKVTATGTGGESATSDEATATSLCAAPSGLSAINGVQSIALAWSPSAGAVSYNLYRGTAAGAESTSALNASPITGTTFTDSYLADGSHYYYTVRAVNAGGVSTASTEAEGWTLLAPPANPFARGGVAGYTLTWSPVTGATGYNVYRGTSWQGESPTPIAVNVNSGYVDTAAPANGMTWYTVAAVNGGRVGQASDDCSCGPAPVGMSVQTAYGVAWYGAAVDGSVGIGFGQQSVGFGIYHLYRGTSPGSETYQREVEDDFGGIADAPPTLQTYYYRFSTLFINGESALSNELAAMPYCTRLIAPVVTGSLSLAGQNVLNWTSVPGASSYDIYRDGKQIQLGFSGTTFTDPSSAATVNSSYDVTAVGLGGEGEFSNFFSNAATLGLSVYPSTITVQAGARASAPVNFTGGSGFDLPIQLSITSAVPAGISSWFYPSTCDVHGSTINITATAGVPPGTYGPFTVKATSGAIQTYGSFSIVIN